MPEIPACGDIVLLPDAGEKAWLQAAAAYRQLTDALVRNSGADPQVKRSELPTAGGECMYPSIRHLGVPLQLERGEERAARREQQEPRVGDGRAARDVEGLELGAVHGEQRERIVRDAPTLPHAERAEPMGGAREGAHPRVSHERAATEGEMLELRASAGDGPAGELPARRAGVETSL